MTVWSRALRGISLHVAALTVLGTVLYAFGGTAAPHGKPGHPAECHVCSTVPPGSSAKFEAFLVQHGYVDTP